MTIEKEEKEKLSPFLSYFFRFYYPENGERYKASNKMGIEFTEYMHRFSFNSSIGLKEHLGNISG